MLTVDQDDDSKIQLLEYVIWEMECIQRLDHKRQHQVYQIWREWYTEQHRSIKKILLLVKQIQVKKIEWNKQEKIFFFSKKPKLQVLIIDWCLPFLSRQRQQKTFQKCVEAASRQRR